MNEIDGINDRKILFLLLHKEKRSKSDDRRLNKLKERYPDYDTHKYQLLMDDLRGKKYIEDIDINPDSPIQSASGALMITDPFGNPRYLPVTTTSGENALRRGFFKSELRDQSRKEGLRRLDVWVKWFCRHRRISGIVQLLQTILLI